MKRNDNNERRTETAPPLRKSVRPPLKLPVGLPTRLKKAGGLLERRQAKEEAGRRDHSRDSLSLSPPREKRYRERAAANGVALIEFMHPRGGFRLSRACIRLGEGFRAKNRDRSVFASGSFDGEENARQRLFFLTLPPAAPSPQEFHAIISRPLTLACTYLSLSYPARVHDKFLWVVPDSRAREIPIFLRGRCSRRDDRGRFAVSDIQSRHFLHARTSAKFALGDSACVHLRRFYSEFIKDN